MRNRWAYFRPIGDYLGLLMWVVAALLLVPLLVAADEFPTECVITGIFRPGNQQFMIPRGSALLQSGDRVFLVAGQSDLRRASRFLHRRASGK